MSGKISAGAVVRETPTLTAMNKIVLLLLSILTLQAAAAQPMLTPAERQIKERLDRCMTRVSNGQADDAFDSLFKEFWKDKTTVGQAAVAMQRNYRNMIGQADQALGQPVPGGYEFIGLKRLGTSVARFIYIQKNEFAFLPWVFFFYRPSQGSEDWKLTHISFPDLTSDDVRDFTVVVFAHP
jgi:hypothetical protein